MKWQKFNMVKYCKQLLLAVCFSSFLFGLGGCNFLSAWNQQAFEADGAAIVGGIDGKYIALDQLTAHAPHYIPQWQQERGEKEREQAKRAQEADLEAYFVKIGGLGISGFQALLGGSGGGLILYLLSLYMGRKKERKVRDRVEEERLIEKAKKHEKEEETQKIDYIRE